MSKRCGKATVDGGQCRAPIGKERVCPHHGPAGSPTTTLNTNGSPAASKVAADEPFTQPATFTPTDAPPDKKKQGTDHIRHLTSEQDYQHVVDRLEGRNVVLVDMDGTMYDPWACCGHRGNFASSTNGCTHLRHDTADAITKMCQERDAVPVVLSYRAGLTDVTRSWMHDIGFDAECVFIPGSDDDIANLQMGYDHKANDEKFGPPQVAFKVATVRALRENIGANPVGSFEDNADVVQALANEGVDTTVKVEHKVKIAKHEYAAGYLGAPTPEHRRDVREKAAEQLKTVGRDLKAGRGDRAEHHRTLQVLANVLQTVEGRQPPEKWELDEPDGADSREMALAYARAAWRDLTTPPEKATERNKQAQLARARRRLQRAAELDR